MKKEFVLISKLATSSILFFLPFLGLTSVQAQAIYFSEEKSCTQNQIANGQTLSGKLERGDCRSQDPSRSKNFADFYYFNGVVNQQISIQITASFLPLLRLYNSQGNILAISSTEINVTLRSTERYVIEVTSDLKKKKGTYTIILSGSNIGGDPPTVCQRIPITFGQTVTGELKNDDCRSYRFSNTVADFFEFTGVSSQKVWIEVSTNFKSSIRVYDQQWNQIGGMDPVLGFGETWPANVTLRTNGRYIVEISGFTAEARGSYLLTLSYLGISCPPTPLGLGSTVVSELQSNDCRSERGIRVDRNDSYFADRYSFVVASKQQARIEVTANFRPFVTLFNQFGGVVTFSNIGPPVILAQEFQVGGTYIIEVTYDDSRSGGGTYQLSLTTPNGSAGCPATSINFGQTVTGELKNDDCISKGRPGGSNYADRYVFTGVVGQQIQIESRANYATFVTLLDESDNILTFSNSGLITYQLRNNGKFFIEVTSDFPRITGSYSLTLR